MTTTSVENYLKAIYKLSVPLDSEEKVKPKSIANHLEVSLPSVTSMMKSLRADHLVHYESYRGVRLTEEGEKKALRVVRKHRLVEMFLVETLNFPWSEVHAEAELLEHAISDRLEASIAEFLGHPRFDPHGDPIPTVDGQLHRRELRVLSEMEKGETATIARVLSQKVQVLKHLTTLGLIPGATFRIENKLSFDGQMKIYCEKGVCEISQTLATMLLVEMD